MSARIADATTAVERRTATVGAAIVMTGVAILWARPFVGAGAHARSALFAASYAVIALASLAVSVDDARSASRQSNPAPWLALAVGVGAVTTVALTGTPVPMPTTAYAVPLSVLAAVAEEALFRRVAYARLARFGPAVAIAGTATVFALVHLPAYGTAALPVDLGAGVLFGWQRWASGSWAVPATTHALANILASVR